MKKILLALFIFFITLTTVNAKQTIVSLTNATGKKGSSVKILVKLKDNPEFGLLGIKIDYNKDILTYEEGKIKGLDNAFMKDIKEVDGTITIYALSLSKLIDETGTIAEIKFKINDNSLKQTPLNIRVTDYGIDENNFLEYETKNGLITIEDGKEDVNQGEKDKENSNFSVIPSQDENNAENVTDKEAIEEKEPQKEEEEHDVISILPYDDTIDFKEQKKSSKKEFNKMLVIPIFGIIILGFLFLIAKNKKGISKNGKEKKDKIKEKSK